MRLPLRGLLPLALLCAIAPLGAEAFAALTAAEAASLGRGEAVVRIARNAAGLGLPADAPAATETRARLRSLGPNYLVEVFDVLPSGAADPLPSLFSALTRPESWVGIPYYSERKDRTYELFSESKTLSREGPDSALRLSVEQLMDPFEAYRASYQISRGADRLVFTGTTSSPLVYKGVKAVKPGDLLWTVIVWKAEGRWYFYGVSAVSAFDLFGAARPRLEPSFIGRTRSFLEFALASLSK